MENNNIQKKTDVNAAKSMTEDSRINLQTLLFVLRTKLVWIILSGILVGSIFALYSVFLITPTYSSTAKFFVNNKAGEMNSSISSADVNASQSLAETSIVLIKNNYQLLSDVIEDSGVKYSASTLKGMLSASVDSGTEVFYIKVTTPSSEDSFRLAQSFQKIVPKELPDNIIEGVTIKPFDEPVKAINHDYPNKTLNTAIGAIIGIVVSFLAFFFREVLDITIYTEEDIKDTFKYPIIGLIPSIAGDTPETRNEKEKSSSKKKKKSKEKAKGE